MPPYTLLAVTSLLSAQSTAARKISTKKYLRTENVAEDASFFNRFLNADESMSAAATVAFAAIANTGGTSTDIPSKSTKSAKAAAKSAKSAKSARAIDVLTMRVDTLEKELAVLEKQTNTHHVDPSCGDNVGRINTLAAGLPEGCKLARFGPDMNTYRLVCYKPGTYNLHLPDMCNASAMLLGGGGSGGNSPEQPAPSQLSGGGGAGGVSLNEDTSFGDGYYLVSIGAGGVNNRKGTEGNGGDTSIELKQRFSLPSSEYPGQELLAFGQGLRGKGGGRGGGVVLIDTGAKFPCSYPKEGGSGGGGVPYDTGDCVNQKGGIAIGNNQGNAGGDGEFLCPGGGGGAGEKGDDGSEIGIGCEGDKGGKGRYVGGTFGEDFGLPGGWFGGGGNPSLSKGSRTLGGGGALSPGVDTSIKNGVANTGGGGMGCAGGSIASQFTCNSVATRDPVTNEEVVFSWGGDGGSGILFIRFDVCPCNDDGN